MKKALIFGSTGFVGSHLLQELLSSPAYERVTAVVRRDPGVSHPKLKTLLGDYNSLPALKTDLACDGLFLALGTTRKSTPNQADYYRVDHDYPVLAARIAKEQGAKSVFLVSSVGISLDSKIFYSRAKAETERDITALDFDHTHLFRPSMIMGNRQEHRSFEKTLMGIWSALDPLFIGKADKYKGMRGEDIAKAMKNAAITERDKVKIYYCREMRALLHS